MARVCVTHNDVGPSRMFFTAPAYLWSGMECDHHGSSSGPFYRLYQRKKSGSSAYIVSLRNRRSYGQAFLRMTALICRGLDGYTC